METVIWVESVVIYVFVGLLAVRYFSVSNRWDGALKIKNRGDAFSIFLFWPCLVVPLAIGDIVKNIVRLLDALRGTET